MPELKSDAELQGALSGLTELKCLPINHNININFGYGPIYQLLFNLLLCSFLFYYSEFK
jgi:hypothetical protein